MSNVTSMLTARGGTTSSGNQLQAFDFLLVVDFEATCEKDKRIYPQEVIEFPSVLVDGATGRIESAFRRYVRPKHNPILTQFCRDLTSIRQEDVEGGVDLGDTLRLHDAWLKAAMAGTGAGVKKGGRLAVVTWGDWDCRSMLESECRFKGIVKPPYFDRWINLRVPFEATWWRKDQPAGGSPGAGLEWEGRLHCGLDDARNTALLVELMRRGAKIEITGSLKPATTDRGAATEASHKPVRDYWLVGAAAADPATASRKPVWWGGDVLLLLWSSEQGRGCSCARSNAGEILLGCGNWTPTMGVVCPFLVWGN